ncbi:MAG: hypothetical protein JXB48_23445 [Candidatus Latescibacteria bacterium]|nr:hypothetical protein [Candidatus Latescibacterota bacterium]
MRIYGYISLCLLIMTIQGCAEKTPYSMSPKSDIEKTNAVRRELGIREIKPDWQFYIHQFNMDKWKDHDYLSKTVQMTEDPNELLWETDEYYTGATWITANNGVAWEHVVIAYDYTAKQFSIDYSGPNAKINILFENIGMTSYGYAANSNEETLKLADKVLSLLGLSRL